MWSWRDIYGWTVWSVFIQLLMAQPRGSVHNIHCSKPTLTRKILPFKWCHSLIRTSTIFLWVFTTESPRSYWNTNLVKQVGISKQNIKKRIKKKTTRIHYQTYISAVAILWHHSLADSDSFLVYWLRVTGCHKSDASAWLQLADSPLFGVNDHQMDLLIRTGALRQHSYTGSKNGYKWKIFCFSACLPMTIYNTLELRDSLANFLVYRIQWSH